MSKRGYAAEVISEATRWNGGRPLDIVWCVAGISTPMLWADDGALAACRHNMDVNFWGAAELAHAVLQEWLAPPPNTLAKSDEVDSERKEEPPPPPPPVRHLVLTASVLAFFAVAGYGPYTPSKWALRGLADTLAQEALLYPRSPVRVHVVYPGTILSPGLRRENATKPEITRLLEKDDPQQTPDEVAAAAIRGLERGRASVTVSWLGEIMRYGVMGGSVRNSWLLDTLGAWLIAVVWFFVQWWIHGDIKAYARKHGHPATYSPKTAA